MWKQMFELVPSVRTQISSKTPQNLKSAVWKVFGFPSKLGEKNIKRNPEHTPTFNTLLNEIVIYLPLQHFDFLL